MSFISCTDYNKQPGTWGWSSHHALDPMPGLGVSEGQGLRGGRLILVITEVEDRSEGTEPGGICAPGVLMPRGDRKEGNGATFVPCLLLTCCQLSGHQRWAGLSLGLSTSLRAGRENKAAAKLANTLAKPINRSPWERLSHPRTVINNEKLYKIRKDLFQRSLRPRGHLQCLV